MSHGHGPDTDEFDRLMALDDEAFQQEATGQQDGGEAPPPAQAAGTPPPEAASGGQEAPGEGGGDGGTTPAQPGATDLPADDWLAALPEDVRTRIQKDREERAQALQESENRFKALHERLAPTQRALSEAQTRLAQMQHRPAAQPSEAPPAPQAGQTLDSYFDSPVYKQWAEDFPGDAKVLRDGLEAQDRALRGQLSQLEAQLQQLNQRLGQTEQVASRTVVNDEISRLEAAHPDWRDLNNSDEFWSWFEDWKVTQPKSLRGQYYDAERLRELWCDSDFAIARISEYKASTAPPPPATVTPPVTPQPESTQPAQPPPRDPRLSMSVAPEVRGSAVPPAISTEGLSEAELFEHVWNQTP